MRGFGSYIRERRESLRLSDRRYSLRQTAARIGVEPSYLSKVEREVEPPPSESRIRALARELGEDPDFLLAKAGKVALDLQRAIRQRPRILPPLIRELKSVSDDAVRRIFQTLKQARPKKEES